jgi:hypothetical protein
MPNRVIQRHFDEAVRTYKTDPKAFLVKARELAEAICKDLYYRHFGDIAQKKTLHQMLARLSDERMIPHYIRAPLRALQSYGNVGAHFQGRDADHITPEYARPCLDSLNVVMTWFLQNYYPELTTRQAPAVTRKRRIDAALPARAGVAQPLRLCVQVRFPDAPLLGTDHRPAGQAPAAMEQMSEPLRLQFPLDPRTGEAGPLTLLVKVNAPDFLIQGDAQKRLEVPPDQESNVLSFFLKARQKGVYQIVIEVYREDDVSLGAIPVSTEIDGQAHTPPVNVVNLFLTVGVATGAEAAERVNAPATELPTFHLVIENKAEMQALSQQALNAIAPQEASVSAGFIAAILEMAARGETLTLDQGLNMSGGFRSEKQLNVTTLVPVLIEVLTRLLNRLGEFSLAEVKQDQAKLTACKQALEQLTPADVLPIMTRTGAAPGKQELRTLTDRLKHTFAAYLGI